MDKLLDIKDDSNGVAGPCVCVVRKSGTGWGLWCGIMSFLWADRKINHQWRDKRHGSVSMWTRELERAKERRGRKVREVKEWNKRKDVPRSVFIITVVYFFSNDFSYLFFFLMLLEMLDSSLHFQPLNILQKEPQVRRISFCSTQVLHSDRRI